MHFTCWISEIITEAPCPVALRDVLEQQMALVFVIIDLKNCLLKLT